MLGLILKNQWRSVILIFFVLSCTGGRRSCKAFNDRLNNSPVHVEYDCPGFWRWSNAIDLCTPSGFRSWGKFFFEDAAVDSGSHWTCTNRLGFHTKDILRITANLFQTGTALFSWSLPNANAMDLPPVDFIGDQKYFGANSDNDHTAYAPAILRRAVTLWQISLQQMGT